MPIIDHSQAPEVPWRPGYRKWDVAGHEQGVTSTFSINTAEPGAGAPLHTHSIDELIVIMEGTLEVSMDGETSTVGPNHTVVIPPGAEHSFRVTGDATAHLLVFFPALNPYSEEHTHYLQGRSSCIGQRIDGPARREGGRQCYHSVKRGPIKRVACGLTTQQIRR